jgi:hypothetical protein
MRKTAGTLRRVADYASRRAWWFESVAVGVWPGEEAVWVGGWGALVCSRRRRDRRRGRGRQDVVGDEIVAGRERAAYGEVEKREIWGPRARRISGVLWSGTRFGWSPAGVGSLGSADCRVVAGGESGSRAKSGMDGWIAKAIPGKWHGLAGMARRVGRDEKPPGEFYIKRADLIRPGGWKGLEERSPTHFVNAPSQTRNERRGPADW